jgi:hypothetical protein
MWNAIVVSIFRPSVLLFQEELKNKADKSDLEGLGGK